MDRGGERRAALAAAAAVAGLGGASGRAMVLFFGQLGGLRWAGIALASALYGLLLAALGRGAAACGAQTPGELFRRLLGRRAGRLAGALHELLLAGMAAAMLSRAAGLGALALPLARGEIWGAGLALALALGLSGRALPALGGIALASGTVLFCALALDPRPVRVYARAETVLALEDNPAAAAVLAALYAALAAALSGGAVLRCVRGIRRPLWLGLLGGLGLAATLTSANWALLRGGRHLLGQAEPGVLLAARWGVAGFWLYAAFAFLGATASLAAVLACAFGGLPRRG